jgi:hypothetical protein
MRYSTKSWGLIGMIIIFCGYPLFGSANLINKTEEQFAFEPSQLNVFFALTSSVIAHVFVQILLIRKLNIEAFIACSLCVQNFLFRVVFRFVPLRI